MPGLRRTAAPLRVLAGIVACAWLLAGCGRSEVAPAAPAAPAASSGPAPEERAYRAKVIDAMRSEEGLAFAEELQQAYTALDRGPDSQEVRDAGGMATVNFVIRNAELAYEAKPLVKCLAAYHDKHKVSLPERAVPRVVRAGRLEQLIADATTIDREAYDRLLATLPGKPTDLGRARAALMVLTSNSAYQAKRAVAVQTSRTLDYLSLATDGECTPSHRFVSILKKAP